MISDRIQSCRCQPWQRSLDGPTTRLLNAITVCGTVLKHRETLASIVYGCSYSTIWPENWRTGAHRAAYWQWYLEIVCSFQHVCGSRWISKSRCRYSDPLDAETAHQWPDLRPASETQQNIPCGVGESRQAMEKFATSSFVSLCPWLAQLLLPNQAYVECSSALEVCAQYQKG